MSNELETTVSPIDNSADIKLADKAEATVLVKKDVYKRQGQTLGTYTGLYSLAVGFLLSLVTVSYTHLYPSALF